jgi:hypothetical protein
MSPIMPVEGAARTASVEVGAVEVGAAVDVSLDRLGPAAGESGAPPQPGTKRTAARSGIDKRLMTATTIWLG